MNEFELKYGCNPNQKPARIFMEDGSELPLRILSGRPGYINFLDALNSWQLVKELKEALGLPAASSFKHVSPTSAAVGLPLSDKLKRACNFFTRIVMLLFFTTLLIYGVRLSALSMGNLSTSLGWPMGAVYAVLPFSALLADYYIVLDMLDLAGVEVPTYEKEAKEA